MLRPQTVMRAATLAIVLGACSLPGGDYFGRAPADPDPHHFRWCNQGEPDSLDPARASSTVSAPLVSALYAGLTTYDMNGLPTPELATRWEISDDLRTYTFHLRDDARWTDGRAITAYDVAYTAIRVLHPLTASPNSDTLAPVIDAIPYLTQRAFVLRQDVPPYRAGEVVVLDGEADPPALAARTSTHALALRELGAPPAEAYARVPAGAEVTLVEHSGGRATPPAPDGRAWAYVFWPRDEDGVYGWVPAGELDGEPNRDAPVTIHADHADGRPAVAARGNQLEATTDVLGIDVPDPYTITFRLNDPTPYFMLITDNRALRTSPIQAVSRWPRRWERPEHAVTSGPMTLTAWREHDVVELARSPVYWDQGAIGVDRISAYSIDDQAASTNIYFTGGCDATAANTIPSTYLPALDGEQTGHAYKDYSVQPFLGVYFAWVNTHRLSNRHLRRALSFAIDRTQIPRFTHGGEIPSAQLTGGTPIAQLSPADLALCGVAHDTPGVALVEVPGQLCYVPPPGLDYDPAAARRELALAKQELGAAFPSTIDYRYNAGSEAHKQIAEYLQSEWAAIGLHVEIDSQEFNSLLQDTKQGDYDLARLGVIASVVDAESEFLSLFKCGNPDNRGQYCSPAFERLMAEARVMGDRKARNAKLREAEAQMIGDVPVIPLYVYTQKHLIEPYVHDYAINLIDQPPLWRVRIEATK